MHISVTYPLAAGQLVLRTEADWERDILPSEVSATGARFTIEMDSPTLALRPCIREGDAIRWARGANYVIRATEPEPLLFPFFYAEARGRLSDVIHLQAESGVHAIRVYHPPGYDENTLRRYPVIYMHDGQNLFFPQEVFQGEEWRVDETLDCLDDLALLRKALVVGVAPADRMREYTMPGYDAYARFMADRLKPLVDARLRTRPGPRDTVVMGSSLGGVASLHLAWSRPDLFGRAACLSSTFGYRDDLFERIAAEPRPDILIYLDSGGARDNYETTNAMRDLLMRRGFRLGAELLHFSFPEASHDEHPWSIRAHLPFQFFLGRPWLAQRGEL
ncbi:MAG: alpha/beta hydrolase-fold protein [Myxococcota bacterium]